MRRDARQIAMTISLLTSVVMLVGKLMAYFLTHSAAILSDAAESVVHGVATGLAAFALWYASRPADVEHPYGHGRIAYFSAGFEGALVFAASIAVLYNAGVGLIRGVELHNLGVGMGISGGLAAINLGLGWGLLRVGRRYNSVVLMANGKHVLSDVWTTAAAIVGVGLVMLTKLTWLDPATGLVLGLYIMASGLGLVRGSFAGLMDEIEPALSERLIRGLRTEMSGGRIVDFHQLRCRRVNDELWVDVHVLVPGELRIDAAHTRVTEVEEAIRRLFPGETVRINSHLEPADHERAHPGGHDGLTDPLLAAARRRTE